MMPAKESSDGARPINIRRREMPDGLWMKCDWCEKMIYRKAVEEALWVCPECNYHFPISARRRVELLLDEGTWEEELADLESADPLEFASYRESIARYQQRTGLKDAALVGTGRLSGIDVVLGVTDSRFMMGSMGSVVGEKITHGAERAVELGRPYVVVSGSGGGARMQEGMVSLMQMAKTTEAVSRLNRHGIPYIVVLTHPSMAGVLASFASLGDVIIAEPKALIGFTGPRVIKQTIKQELPEGFQRSEFLLEHGMIDMIVNRGELKETLARLLKYLVPAKKKN